MPLHAVCDVAARGTPFALLVDPKNKVLSAELDRHPVQGVWGYLPFNDKTSPTPNLFIFENNVCDGGFLVILI